MSFISRVNNTLFNASSANAPSAAAPSETAPTGVPPCGIAPVAQAAGIAAAVSSSNELGGRLITTQQSLSSQSNAVPTRSALGKCDLVSLEKRMAWACEGDDDRLGHVARSFKNSGECPELARNIGNPFFNKLATTDPDMFREMMLFKHDQFSALITLIMQDADKINAFRPQLVALAEAAPSNFPGMFREMMMVKQRCSAMEIVMSDADKINAFRSVLEALAEVHPLGFTDMFKEVMIETWHNIPIDLAMSSADKINAFCPIIEILATTDPSGFPDLFRKKMMTKFNYMYFTPMDDVMRSADKINAFRPVLTAHPSECLDMYKRIMMGYNLRGETPIHEIMSNYYSINDYLPVVKAIIQGAHLNFPALLKEMLLCRSDWSDYTPMNALVHFFNNDKIKAFIPYLEILADIGAEELHEILQANVGNGRTLIQIMQERLPEDEFISFLRNSALNIEYSSQMRNARLN